MEIIKFAKKDLLDFDEVEKLIISVVPNEKAIIIANKLLNYLLIHKGDFYRFDVDNVLYIKEDNDDDYILTNITSFIAKSYENLSQNEQEILKLKYKKSYDAIFVNTNVGKYMPQLRTYLTNNKIDFSDPHINEIHFKNGFFNFMTGKFEKRIAGKHYINYHISREYHEPKPEVKSRVMKDITKIYPNEDDRNYLLMTYGIALTGQACVEQTILFLLGKGSSGKSTIIELCKLAIEEYVFTLPKQTLSRGYTKIDKILNSYIAKPYIKMSSINEPEDTKIDETLFKDWIDGNIQTTSLYKDGSNDFKHHSKIIITANTFPNIKVDSGTVRRIDSFNHQSHFVKVQSEVDENNNIYLANLDFLKSCKKDFDYLNAFFSIIALYGFNWLYKSKIYKQTSNFKDTKDTIVSSNDIIQDFIDKCLTITKQDKDRIGRDEMHELFKTNFARSIITPTQLLSSLKQKDIDYKADYRHNGLKGCFVGVKVKEEEDENKHPELDGKTIREVVLEKEIENLKRQIEDLQSQLKPVLVKPEIVIKEIIQTAPVNDEDIVVIPKQETETLDDIKALDTHIKNSKKQAKEKQVYKPVRKVVSYKNDTPNSKELDDLLAEIDTV